MDSLSGKIALVTGGTRGIGHAIVERLIAEGASVAFCGRTQESVEKTLSAFERSDIFAQPADITNLEEVRQLFRAIDERFGGLDVLVNNAGVGAFHKVAEMTPEEWHRNIDLNLNAAFYCTREALPRFQKRGGGFVVNVSSLAGINAFSGGAGYNASKFGLNGFSEALLLDHRYDNVRVSYIMPGSVNTEFAGHSDKSGDNNWRIAPEDVAEAVAMVLRMPARTMVSRIEMRPSRPRK
jgi:NAD(P)-dependent dehydrogenase (short-subunit alcohol dehydrogenase family)